MADSKKTNFTYRVNTKTPAEVEEWLATKPDGLSYPEFVNAAIMVARSKEEGSEIDLDAITSSLADMVAKQGVAPAGQAPQGASASPEEVAEAVEPVVERDGERTRRHIDEAVESIGQMLDSMPQPEAGQGGASTSIDEAVVTVPSPEVDLSGVASKDDLADLAQSVSTTLGESVETDGERTRDAIGRVDEKVDAILEAMQSASVEPMAEGADPAGGEPDDGPNVVEDGTLTEEDINFAVQRIKDTIRTDGQKTRNAIVSKLDQTVASLPKPEEPRPAISPDEMHELFESLRQSNQAMLESLERKLEKAQPSGAQGTSDIVFDEATTSFFKRIHSSVSSILIRVDAMQAQLEHIQKIVERNGSTLRTMSRGDQPDDGRVILPSINQFDDASLFDDAPEIEDLPSDSGRIPKWHREQPAKDPVAEPAPDGPIDFSDPGSPDDGHSQRHPVISGIMDNLMSMTEPYLAASEPSPDQVTPSSNDVFVSLLGDVAKAEGSQTEDVAERPEEGDEEKGDAPKERRPRISVPRRRRSPFHGGAHGSADDEAKVDEGGNEPTPLTHDDVMQPTGAVPASSPGAEPVEEIIDGLDFDSVGSVASDPDELLTDTLQSLLG